MKVKTFIIVLIAFFYVPCVYSVDRATFDNLLTDYNAHIDYYNLVEVMNIDLGKPDEYIFRNYV